MTTTTEDLKIRKNNTIILEQDDPILEMQIDIECEYLLQVWISYHKGSRQVEHTFTLNRN